MLLTRKQKLAGYVFGHKFAWYRHNSLEKVVRVYEIEGELWCQLWKTLDHGWVRLDGANRGWVPLNFERPPPRPQNPEPLRLVKSGKGGT